MINNIVKGTAKVRDANPNFICMSIVSAANAANKTMIYMVPMRSIATSSVGLFFIIIYYLFFISMRWAMMVIAVMTPYIDAMK